MVSRSMAMRSAGRSEFVGGSSSTVRQRTVPRDSLPVRRHGARIVEKILENRVTLIFADAGSGKSSQVPQLLLERGLTPVMCTQPRRLAVVAVAKRVAEERRCALGEEVGYQIGQLNLSKAGSKIVFKTAGVMFEELRSDGVGTLAKYKVIILDEVHERSVESDLVLTCIRQLLRTTNVKLVLMSATADLLKYEDYFKELHRDDGVEKIAIQNLADQLQSVILNTKVLYLEQTVKLLGNRPEHQELLDSLTQTFAPAEKGTDIGDGIQNLIKELILHLHKREEDMSKTLLVFLPTYRALEQQWLLLKNMREFQVYVLHSSIEVDTCVKAMEACQRGKRKIILATNVAESSVTISGVSFVIDACRSLEVYWDNKKGKDHPRIVWISESQANQRKGRTGRTCDGVVYRLVPRNRFLRLEKFETPAMQLLSLRKQVLMILCAESRALNDPAALLKKCLNAPTPETVQAALSTLQEMNAIAADPRGKHHPTLYGQLLVALPLSLEASVVVVRGGQLGYPWESAVLAAIMDSSPNPILRPFANHEMYAVNLGNYYNPDEGDYKQAKKYLKHSHIMLANLYAFEFWQLYFKNKQRERFLKQVASNTIQHQVVEEIGPDISERSWCEKHNLSITALHAVAETVDCIMEALHRHRPEFLSKVSGSPAYHRSSFAVHACQEKDEGTSTELSDNWNEFYSQRSDLLGGSDGDGYNSWAVPPPGSFDTGADPWSDWSFQESEKVMNGRWHSEEESDEYEGHSRTGVQSHSRGTSYSTISIETLGSGNTVSYNQELPNGGNWSFANDGERCHHVIDVGSSPIKPPPKETSSVTPPDFADIGSNMYGGVLACASVPYTRCGTFYSPEDEKALTALIEEVQKGSSQAAGLTMDECSTLGDNSATSTPICAFYLRGNCMKGTSCPFLHNFSAKRTVCRYYNTPVGCRFGPACIYYHEKEEKPVDHSPVRFDEAKPTPKSMLDLLPALNVNELLLLFGEGNFSFAESLTNFIDPKRIFATSFDSRNVVSNDDIRRARLEKLESLQMQIVWNVDATSLHSSASGSNRGLTQAARILTQSIPWYDVRCVLWNFPFTGVDESTMEHKELMMKFFVTLSVIMICMRITAVPVIITLCKDQFCRWQVERAAREAFFFLRTSAPFDVKTFGGYRPIRNNLGSTFPVQRPLIYVFDLHTPSDFEIQRGRF